MNHIGFSHRYSKLHGQTSGTLLWVVPFVINGNTLTDETIQYDTDGVFPLPEGSYLQLVFLGDKQIPFTTYRDDTPEHRERFCDHIHQKFTFNFKKGC